MTHDTSDPGNSTPAQKAMKQTSKVSDQTENEDDDPVGSGQQPPTRAEEVSEGDKPVGESDNDGSSHDQPNQIVKKQRDSQ